MGEVRESQRPKKESKGRLNGDQIHESGSKDRIVRTYDLKLYTGGLLWHELKAIAQVMDEETDDKRVREIVLEENLLNRKTKKTASNLFSYLYQRLNSTSPSIVKLIAHAESRTSKQACLVASMSSSRMLREFFANVVSEKLESSNPTLPSSYWRSFWSSCVSKAPKLESTRDKAIDEIRQKTISFLVDLSILDSAPDKELRAIKFAPKLKRAIEKDCDKDICYSLRAFL